MDNQFYQYLKEKINKAEKLQKAIKEIDNFIGELDYCNNNSSMVLGVGKPGKAETIIGNYSAIDSNLVCKHFYRPLIDAALKLKEQLEQEYKEL